ncbi:MAG: hypothetical protein HQL12_00185 [Candidatus Omnitrophica bacterium]|nr:hypothetical protein [Candidatus Omnitrophota bacterium]
MFKRILNLIIIFCFLLTALGPLPKAHADSVLGLPAPGTMVNLSPAYEPVIIKGLTVHKDNPFLFDFIVDVGQDKMSGEPLKKEGEKLIKYFLASLAIPDKDVWVNLSPYENNKIIPEALGQTDMGRDLLEQDYILKQITASLIYPEKQLGKTFWDKVYAKARQTYGTTQVPVNTFNKVWIMADRAEVFEHNQTAFVVDQHLKVMLEEDYLALQKHQSQIGTPTRGHVPEGAVSPSRLPTNEALELKAPQGTSRLPSNSLASQIVKEIILPELEKEVNTGKNFANLRQIFNSIILSSWYKKNLKEALLNQVYANKAKVKGIDLNDPTVKRQIYEQYLKAYKKGVFNYIKEDVDAAGATIPHKYFSGGLLIEGTPAANPAMTTDVAALSDSLPNRAMVIINAGVVTNNANAAMPSPAAGFDEAMASSVDFETAFPRIFKPLEESMGVLFRMTDIENNRQLTGQEQSVIEQNIREVIINVSPAIAKQFHRTETAARQFVHLTILNYLMIKMAETEESLNKIHEKNFTRLVVDHCWFIFQPRLDEIFRFIDSGWRPRGSAIDPLMEITLKVSARDSNATDEQKIQATFARAKLLPGTALGRAIGNAAMTAEGLKKIINRYLDGMQELKQKLHNEMTPEIKGKRKLPDDKFDFDRVFNTLLKGPSAWYSEFWDMVALAEQRGVEINKLKSNGHNIFDQFEDGYQKVYQAFIENLQAAGINIGASYYDLLELVNKNQDLPPQEIALKLLEYSQSDAALGDDRSNMTDAATLTVKPGDPDVPIAPNMKIGIRVKNGINYFQLFNAKGRNVGVSLPVMGGNARVYVKGQLFVADDIGEGGLRQLEFFFAYPKNPLHRWSRLWNVMLDRNEDHTRLITEGVPGPNIYNSGRLVGVNSVSLNGSVLGVGFDQSTKVVRLDLAEFERMIPAYAKPNPAMTAKDFSFEIDDQNVREVTNDPEYQKKINTNGATYTHRGYRVFLLEAKGKEGLNTTVVVQQMKLLQRLAQWVKLPDREDMHNIDQISLAKRILFWVNPDNELSAFREDAATPFESEGNFGLVIDPFLRNPEVYVSELQKGYHQKVAALQTGKVKVFIEGETLHFTFSDAAMTGLIVQEVNKLMKGIPNTAQMRDFSVGTIPDIGTARKADDSFVALLKKLKGADPEILREVKRDNKETISKIETWADYLQAWGYIEETSIEAPFPSPCQRSANALLALFSKSAIKNDAAMAVDRASRGRVVNPDLRGGIDLNTSGGMQWKVSKDGKGVEMDIDPVMVARIRREGIESLSPVIFRITPITSVWPLMGLQTPVKGGTLAGV